MTTFSAFFFFSSRRRHTRSDRDWSSDVCSSDLARVLDRVGQEGGRPVEVLLQVDLGGAAGDTAARGGADPATVPELADVVALSAGMSGDLEAAVEAGATVVRVGTALFGHRPLTSGEDRNTPATRVTPV